MAKDKSPNALVWLKYHRYNNLGHITKWVKETNPNMTCREMWLNYPEAYGLSVITTDLKTAKNYETARGWRSAIYERSFTRIPAEDFRQKCVELKCYQWCRND